MDIQYTITFYSPWHCGSGLSAGADLDALVIKDANNLPYVPGRTIKGLVREALTEIISFQKETTTKKETEEKQINTILEPIFFSNATLNEQESKAIIAHDASEHLYQKVSSTAIDDQGIAKDHSLHETEVVVPCEVVGQLLHFPDENNEETLKALKILVDALLYIKRLGANRNRGLGRCEFKITSPEVFKKLAEGGQS